MDTVSKAIVHVCPPLDPAAAAAADLQMNCKSRHHRWSAWDVLYNQCS